MIWLTGCNGMLGMELSFLFNKEGVPFVGTDSEIDITDFNALDAFLKKQMHRIKWLINCAAYTAVDKAEDDIERCMMLNVLGPANIAKCAKNTGAKFIQLSTDYVFDGNGIIENEKLRPYREDDETNPSGIYGISKRDGEIEVFKNNPNSFIIRTSWLYGKYGKNFVDTMLRLMNERNVVKVVDDQRGSPTWTYDLASVILFLINLIDSRRSIPYGIYHYSNDGNITWFDFAKEIYRKAREFGILEKDCEVKPCTSSEYPARAKRPAYSLLDKSKIQKNMGINIPAWNKSLSGYLKHV